MRRELAPLQRPADFAGAAVVGQPNLGVLPAAWGQTFGAPDIHGFGLIDATDIEQLLGHRRECP